MVTQLLLWSLMAYGITNIVVYGSIFNGPREIIRKWSEGSYPFSEFGTFIKNMTACPMCFGTWFGFFAGIFLYSPVHEMLGVSRYASWFFDGMLASGSVWAINAIVEWFEENRPSNRK
jgi:predicted transporter